jgi:CubicO group peptidase (beta-lactamase class C family)
MSSSQLCHPAIMLLAVALAIAGCAARERPANHDQQNERPAGSVDEWDTASPAHENLDPELIEAMLARVRDGSYKNIHGILLVRNGKLVVEEYFPGQDSEGNPRVFDRDTLHELHSATKSVNALLLGIAIDQGLIRGVDQAIASFFPEYADVFAADKGKTAISLKDCLSMTAGLSWDESLPYTDPRNDHVTMNNSGDPIRYVLERPLAAKPGTRFLYNSGIAIVMGEIIHKASGLRADEFAERYLFAPLGIRNYHWQRYPNQLVQTGGGLSLRPRDMAKIGLLVQSGGRWRGKQIVSEAWIHESIRQQASDLPYGYQWWLLGDPPQPSAAYGALGRGGQLIIVIPELEMVAVFTGWNDGQLFGTPPFDMLKRYVLPADAKMRER